MPSVFISYSSQQQGVAQQLETELESKGIEVWRDKAKLHVGQRWPKALGDAIAASDAILLLWSIEANQSDFVELEWNIAVAMHKPVMPCLLDNTSLPHTLTQSNCIPGGDIHQVAEKIMAALKGLPPSVPIKQQDKLLETLDAAPETEPQQVLKHFNTIINQPNWSVGGNVYQPQGDLYIGTTKTVPTKKPLVERWQTWMGLVVSILTAVTLFLSLPTTGKDFLLSWMSQSPTSRSLGGFIYDKQTHKPLPHVHITLTGAQLENAKKTSDTNEQGYFLFQESVPKETKVTLEAKLPGYVRVWFEDIEFGDSKMKFVMERDVQ